MAKDLHRANNQRTHASIEPLPRDLKKWVPLLLFLLSVGVGSWYWATRPANVQAAIVELRDASNVDQVMTVESISEGDASLVAVTSPSSMRV